MPIVSGPISALGACGLFFALLTLIFMAIGFIDQKISTHLNPTYLSNNRVCPSCKSKFKGHNVFAFSVMFWIFSVPLLAIFMAVLVCLPNFSDGLEKTVFLMAAFSFCSMRGMLTLREFMHKRPLTYCRSCNTLAGKFFFDKVAFVLKSILYLSIGFFIILMTALMVMN